MRKLPMVLVFSLIALTAVPLNVTGQQHCTECAMPCDMTTESYSYDMWFCSCPTDSSCTMTGICTGCYYDGFEMCIDWYNGCETFYQSVFSSNCGCDQQAD